VSPVHLPKPMLTPMDGGGFTVSVEPFGYIGRIVENGNGWQPFNSFMDEEGRITERERAVAWLVRKAQKRAAADGVST